MRPWQIALSDHYLPLSPFINGKMWHLGRHYSVVTIHLLKNSYHIQILGEVWGQMTSFKTKVWHEVVVNVAMGC